MPGQDRDAWRSYDSVADAYVRVRSVRNAMLARDLVAAVAPPFGGRVPDVGAGTGVAADAAALAVHPFLNERRLFPELGEPMTQI